MQRKEEEKGKSNCKTFCCSFFCTLLLVVGLSVGLLVAAWIFDFQDIQAQVASRHKLKLYNDYQREPEAEQDQPVVPT